MAIRRIVVAGGGIGGLAFAQAAYCIVCMYMVHVRHGHVCPSRFEMLPCLLLPDDGRRARMDPRACE